jgi:hypothetical protein
MSDEPEPKAAKAIRRGAERRCRNQQARAGSARSRSRPSRHPYRGSFGGGRRDRGGIGALPQCSSRARRPERLGLVIDRDGVDGKPDRWNVVREILRSAGLEAPAAPPSDGYRAVTAWGRVGVWLMPDNVRFGDLETFLEDLLGPPSSLWDHAGESTLAARRCGAKYRDIHATKARFHAWLAWHDPPGQPYGTAIASKTLSAHSPAADAFVAWFRELCLAD